MARAPEGYETKKTKDITIIMESRETVHIHQVHTYDAPASSKVGGLYSSGGDVIETPFNFVPVYMYRTPSTPSVRFGQGEEWPRSDTIMLVLSEDSYRLYQLVFSGPSSSYYAGLIIRHVQQGLSLWENVFQLDTKHTEQRTGDSPYYAFTAKVVGRQTDSKLSVLAQRVHEQYGAMRRALQEKSSEVKAPPPESMQMVHVLAKDGKSGAVFAFPDTPPVILTGKAARAHRERLLGVRKTKSKNKKKAKAKKKESKKKTKEVQQ